MAKVTARAGPLEQIRRFEATGGRANVMRRCGLGEVSCVSHQMLGELLRPPGSSAFSSVRTSSSGAVGIFFSWAKVPDVPATPGGSAHLSWA